MSSVGRVHTGHGQGHLSLLHAARDVGCKIQRLGRVGSWRCRYSGVSQLRLVVSRALCGLWLDRLHALSVWPGLLPSQWSLGSQVHTHCLRAAKQSVAA